MIVAVKNDRKDFIEPLLQHGADINAVCNNAPFESASIAAVDRKYYDIAAMLLAYGADLHYRARFGTALDYAFASHHTGMVRLLWNSHFPEDEWNRTLFACNSQIEEH